MSALSMPRALCSTDDSLLACENRLAVARTQAAVVRTFLEEVERTAPSTVTRGALAEQLVEELARLGCDILEAAAAMARAVDEPSAAPGASTVA